MVDESRLRRGLASANAVFGNKASVLVGDFLFARAFQLMVEDGSLRVLAILSQAAATIAEGEVLQLVTQNDLATSEAQYLDVIRGKTAALFAAACQVGAVVAARPAAEEAALADFGMNLGIAFQLVDDALDYAADQATARQDRRRRFPRGQDHPARPARPCRRRPGGTRLLAPHDRGERADRGRSRHRARVDGPPRRDRRHPRPGGGLCRRGPGGPRRRPRLAAARGAGRGVRLHGAPSPMSGARGGGRAGLVILFASLAGANLAAWIWAWAAFAGRPALLGTALLAWVFGLRHALDADHIAAIDNVVRTLLRQGRRPVTTGLWFSLGHSTIVVLVAVAVAALAGSGRLPDAARFGAVFGTLASALVLLALALVNLAILRDLWAVFRRVRQGAALDPGGLERLLAGRGLLARLFRPLFRLVDAAWHMYPIGLLFGLGFDTATEIGLLAISAGAAMHGMAPWQTMVFPALFTAGMALVDTADSALMVGAYGWALADPLRKLWYNLTMTAASVLVALLIGGVETLALLAGQLHLTGALWQGARRLNENLTGFGIAVVGVFALCWAVSAVLFRRRALTPAPPGR